MLSSENERTIEGTGPRAPATPRNERPGMRDSALSSAEAASALDRASAEGRVDGKFRCPRCGMRSALKIDAQKCCEGLGPSALEVVSESRYERSK